MIGGLQLASCCANPVPDADVPAFPFTTLTCNYIERQTFNATYLPVVQETYTSNHPGCQPQSRTVGWYSPAVYFFNGAYGTVASYAVNAVATGQATWTASTVQVLSGVSGPILRAGTDIVIASANYRYKRTTFTLASRTRTATNGVVVSGTITRQAGTQDCCVPEDSVIYTFDIISQGNPVTSSTPAAATSHTVSWVGVCNQQVPGLTLTRTATSPATDPWKIEVVGGVIRLTDVNGNAYEYSGLLNTVRTQITNAGFFSAVNGPIVVTQASTSDLIPVRHDQIREGCAKGLLIADVGHPIAPGVAFGFNGQVSVGSSGGYTEFFNASSSGYSNSLAGALSWINRSRYPKINVIQPLGTFESTTNSYLGLSLRWLDIPGSSVITEDQIIPAFGPGDDRTDVTDTLSCVSCVTFPAPNPCDPCPPPNNAGTGGVFPLTRTLNFCPDRIEVGFSDCTGGIVDDICGSDCNGLTPDPYLTVCVSRTTEVTPLVTEDLAYPLTQRMTGSLTFS